ncbi:hypothetical protein GA830_10485 [Mesorhizobium sp. NBSH29]|uniref:hypothetical protein n=1 Tax=Mesorhizobium sp. NBSH29 TaxID=2654249 RepID=UPI00189662A1|nr:hypothetical protein [Mesorhizobium sp. NBSH29]QPC87121.1 hypothetical protein GA830_10485 [Mesorhizobium sp. NBSH29]
MGDRTHALIMIGGHLETVADTELFLRMMSESTFDNQDINSWTSALREAIEENRYLEDEDSEVNYGTFDDYEAAVKAAPGMGCSTYFDAGGGYGAGVRTIMPDKTEHQCSTDDGVMVGLLALIEARKNANPLTAIDDLIERTHIAAGDSLPKMTASPSVHSYLKIFGRKTA